MHAFGNYDSQPIKTMDILDDEKDDRIDNTVVVKKKN